MANSVLAVIRNKSRKSAESCQSSQLLSVLSLCLLTIEDHGKLVALKLHTNTLALLVEIESVLEHGFFFTLLVSHEVVIFVHVRVIISGCLATIIVSKERHLR